MLTWVSSCVMNATVSNYKLRSAIGREDNFTANKRTWFDTQVCAIFLWSWMISRALVNYTKKGLLDNVQAPYMSENNSNKTITSYVHTSMVVHPGFNDHFQI